MNSQRVAILGKDNVARTIAEHFERISRYELVLPPAPSVDRWLNCIPLAKDELDGIDIKEEYELVQQKKSKLSARLRKMVVRRFERSNP